MVGAYSDKCLQQAAQVRVKIRQVVVLYYIEQFTVKEIKQILKIPEGTVKSRLSKGRKLMKNYLTE